MTKGEEVSQEHTVIATWAAAIADGLACRGHDVAALFEQAGLDYRHLHEKHVRYPARQMFRLWDLAADVTGDDAIGLGMAELVQPSAWHAMGIVIMMSESLRDAINHLQRYSRLISTAAQMQVSEQGDSLVMALGVQQQQQGLISPHAVDAVVAATVKFFRVFSHGRFVPQRVCLQRKAPRHAERYEAYFQAPVEFERTENQIWVAQSLLDQPLPGANPELSKRFHRLAEESLQALDRPSLHVLVRGEIMRQLPAGPVTLALIAQLLHMSERNLQRKLEAEGLSFHRILTELRHELALHYLQDAAYSLQEVAYLLGYSDQSNFVRAFRSWTGMAPSAYRLQQALNSSA